MKRLYLKLTDPKGIDNIINELKDYSNSLDYKLQIFVDELLEVGIETAYANTGQYAGMILFTKTVNPAENGFDCLLIGMDRTKILREWRYKGGIKSAIVSPLLMAEFGSGWLAKVINTGDYRSNALGVGQGTFPGQTHAFDKDGWFWETPDGEKHHSVGEEPTYPMYSAYLGMLFDAERIAKEVFDE